MRLFLSRAHFPVTTLGPGRRVGLWFQGCSIRCVGCISADTWRFGRGETTVQAALAALDPWLGLSAGLTVSGGEPFDQPDALAELLGEVRRRYPIDVLVYTGYPIERLKLERFDQLIDALISDPYEVSRSQTLPLRGSDNQRLHLLTDLGRSRFSCFTTPREETEKAFDVVFRSDGSAWLAGIPSHRDFERLESLLTSEGHRVTTSRQVKKGPVLK